jgi:hypothetical protein
MDKKIAKAEGTKNDKEELMHEFKAAPTRGTFSMKLIPLFLIITLLGVGTGYVLADKGGSGIKPDATGSVGKVEQGKIYGTDDTKTFKDTAEGTLEKGGIEGEGQFHLVRPGGESQNVYLTSSYVDLSEFVGKKIKVWGQTQTAQKAGWLMDVGRVEVL